jgi:hypothetical protein
VLERSLGMPVASANVAGGQKSAGSPQVVGEDAAGAESGVPECAKVSECCTGCSADLWAEGYGIYRRLFNEAGTAEGAKR